jgi:NADPH:quinone reductase-like Zn-dependent oxidoreductase
MAAPFPPSTIKAWQYMTTKGGLEKNLKLNPSVPLPTPSSTQNLVQIIATALNPVDYKPAENALISRLAIPKPATPGIDFAGLIVTPAAGSPLKRGQLVFGVAGTSPLAAGALSQFAITPKEATVAVPEGIDPIDAATVGVAGLTAYQSIVPRVKKGDKILINGGSGGTGVFGVQIAKAVGCHVTTTCSTANVELCKVCKNLCYALLYLSSIPFADTFNFEESRRR